MSLTIEAISVDAVGQMPTGGPLWYVLAMRLRSPNPAPASQRRVAKPPSAPRPPLSVIHAKALHVPVPPVGYDDEGYPFEDSTATEGMFQFETQVYLFNVMRARYGDREDTLVCNDQALFFERGTRGALVVPDSAVAFEVRGRDEGNLLSYKVWEQGKPPDFVMEILSKKTWRNDVHRKPGLYADLNVREYWLFDPDGVSGGPQLRGGELDSQGTYQPLPTLPDGAIHSPLLELDFLHEGPMLHCRDPKTGELIPRYEEISRLRQAAAERADEQRTRAEAAEARVAELEALLRQSGKG